MAVFQKLRISLVALTLWIGASSLYAVPLEISYGGRLTDSAGVPLRGTVDLEVKFYRSSNGSDLVPVTVPAFSGVSLQDGVFQVIIALSAADFHVIFNDTDPVWIQIKDMSNGITYPRQKFATTPYALKVPVDGKFVTYNVDGQLTLGASGAAPGKFLKLDGSGEPVWDNIPGGGDMISTNNLNDVDDVATARTNLGLGNAATKNVGTGAGDVATGNHNHTMSSISDAGSLATKNAVGSADITDGDVTSTDIADGTITDADINATASISHLKISGLGAAATKNVGTAAADVAAGNHTHTMSSVSDAGALATKNTVATADIDDNAVNANKLAADAVTSAKILNGEIVNADISNTAAIAGTKIAPNFGAQNITTTGVVSGVGSGLTKLPIPGFIYGFEMSYNGNNSVAVSAGQAMSDDNSFFIESGALTFSFDNGIGVVNGSQAADAVFTVYDLYVIADSTGTNSPGLYAQASGSAVTLPSGYDKKRLIGAFSNGSGANIYYFTQTGKGNTRRFLYSLVPLLTNTDTSTFVTQSLATYVPASAKIAILRAYMTTIVGGVTKDFHVRPLGDTTNPNSILRVTSNSTQGHIFFETGVGTNTSIEYRTSNTTDGGVSLYVGGFILDL